MRRGSHGPSSVAALAAVDLAGIASAVVGSHRYRHTAAEAGSLGEGSRLARSSVADTAAAGCRNTGSRTLWLKLWVVGEEVGVMSSAISRC